MQIYIENVKARTLDGGDLKRLAENDLLGITELTSVEATNKVKGCIQNKFQNENSFIGNKNI